MACVSVRNKNLHRRAAPITPYKLSYRYSSVVSLQATGCRMIHHNRIDITWFIIANLSTRFQRVRIIFCWSDDSFKTTSGVPREAHCTLCINAKIYPVTPGIKIDHISELTTLVSYIANLWLQNGQLGTSCGSLWNKGLGHVGRKEDEWLYSEGVTCWQDWTILWSGLSVGYWYFAGMIEKKSNGYMGSYLIIQI